MSADGAGYAPPELIGRLRALAGNGPAPDPDVERCDLCGAGLPADHRHLLQIEERSIRCACEPCVAMRSAISGSRPTPQTIRARSVSEGRVPIPRSRHGL